MYVYCYKTCHQIIFAQKSLAAKFMLEMQNSKLKLASRHIKFF